ncbi:MAG: hypothetical protein R2695_14435 [Acidimicrobiales bacterium]
MAEPQGRFDQQLADPDARHRHAHEHPGQSRLASRSERLGARPELRDGEEQEER